MMERRLWFFNAHQGHLDVVRFLVESGANKDQGTTDNGSTPLYIAAHEGHLEVVPCLGSSWKQNAGGWQKRCWSLFCAYVDVFVVGCCCLLFFGVCYLLFCCYLLFAMFVVCGLLFGVCSLLSVVCCVLVVVGAWLVGCWFVGCCCCCCGGGGWLVVDVWVGHKRKRFMVSWALA